jgi:hypothetical protein
MENKDKTSPPSCRFSVRALPCLVFLLPGILWAVGCSSDNNPNDFVTGKVTLDGKPVSGFVIFINASGQETRGIIKLDGTYLLPDLPKGQYQVAVKAIEAAPTPPDAKMKDMPAQTTTGVSPPARYAAPDNGLTCTVTGGKQTYDIKLTP